MASHPRCTCYAPARHGHHCARTGPRQDRTTTGPDHSDDWEARLREAVAETIRRRQARRQQREQLAAARAHGLKRRHHTKLNPKDKP